VRADGITVRAGGITVRAGRIAVRAGRITVRAGRITVRADGITVRADGITLRAGRITVRAGRITPRASGITLRAGGIQRCGLSAARHMAVHLQPNGAMRLEEPTLDDLEQLVELLRAGASSAHYYALLLGLRNFEWPFLLSSVEEGLEYGAWEHLRRNLSIPADELAEIVDIPPRTLTRRKSEGKFAPDESDRLLRVSRVFAKALEVFEGEPRHALTWLSSAQLGLGGSVPLEILRTEIGTREVENLLGRLDEGVFA
jgi:putative toxin-antitoxin system antitoxin component (TIGR02293 family)